MNNFFLCSTLTEINSQRIRHDPLLNGDSNKTALRLHCELIRSVVAVKVAEL